MTQNKFLKHYPQLRNPQVGDTVIMITYSAGWWDKDDVGKIDEIHKTNSLIYPLYRIIMTERNAFIYAARNQFNLV